VPPSLKQTLHLFQKDYFFLFFIFDKVCLQSGNHMDGNEILG